jgi:1,4-alpha-glucan branching enzyme
MPYVEGFGTWPFGEEWLWEAIATCYLPLLDLLDRDLPITLSLTPVLCDQLEVADLVPRFTRFVTEVRRHTHLEDAEGLRKGGHPQLAQELDRSLRDYEGAAERLADRGCNLLAAFAPHAQWTSAATHAVLPLLATDACVSAQAQVGIDSHRRRFGGGWQGGFWLPECAHAPDLEPVLAAAGVRACCVELTKRLGLGAREQLRPLVGESGIALLPIDRETISLVWSDDGYPAHPCYRDYHRHTVHHHNPWSNDGSAYDHAAAIATAQQHAADFVARTRQRLADAAADPDRSGPLPGGGLVVCALDTELLGHWWYEGIVWLTAVVEECARQGLELMRVDEALAGSEPAPLLDGGSWEPSTWGSDGDLSTWSGPPVAEIAFAQREAELRLIEAGAEAGEAAFRQLLGMQASDWAFMVTRELALPYARQRFADHSEAFERALRDGLAADVTSLRNLAPKADPSLLSRPIG